nr:porin [uncultured Carboxylicivirga sp.]
MKTTVTVFLTAFLFFISGNAIAQEEKSFEPTLKISGFTHMWIGYVQRDSLDVHYGFIPRYVRLKATGKLTTNVKYGAQFSYDKGTPSLLDIYLSYEPYSYFNIRFGQFPVPGIKSAVHSSSLWSTTKMKLNDRPTISQNWNSNVALSGFRSGGIMFYGDIYNSIVHYYVMASMPHAGPNYYWNPSVKSPRYENDENGLALFSRLEFTPIKNTETGISFHTGSGTVGDTIKTNRNSFSVYFLTHYQKLHLMTEYIAGMNKQFINDIEDSEISYSGFYAEATYLITSNLEPAFRYDYYIPIKDGFDSNGIKKYSNVTFGINYYPSKNIALMTNYVIRTEDAITGTDKIHNDLFYFQLRFKF